MIKEKVNEILVGRSEVSGVNVGRHLVTGHDVIAFRDQVRHRLFRQFVDGGVEDPDGLEGGQSVSEILIEELAVHTEILHHLLLGRHAERQSDVIIGTGLQRFVAVQGLAIHAEVDGACLAELAQFVADVAVDTRADAAAAGGRVGVPALVGWGLDPAGLGRRVKLELLASTPELLDHLHRSLELVAPVALGRVLDDLGVGRVREADVLVEATRAVLVLDDDDPKPLIQLGLGSKEGESGDDNKDQTAGHFLRGLKKGSNDFIEKLEE